MVFRGMAQRAPIAYVTPRAAIWVCAHLSASLWHVFSFPFALILGVRFSVLYSNVEVNSVYGHEFGDKPFRRHLCAVAQLV